MVSERQGEEGEGGWEEGMSERMSEIYKENQNHLESCQIPYSAFSYADVMHSPLPSLFRPVIEVSPLLR